MGFQWTLAKFFWYIFFMYFTLLYFTYYGMMCVGLTPNDSVSAIISSAFYGIWNLFSGFLIPRPVSSLQYLLVIVTITHSQIKSFIATFSKFFFSFLCTENASMVEMVLLGMPHSVELVWNASLSIR